MTESALRMVDPNISDASLYYVSLPVGKPLMDAQAPPTAEEMVDTWRQPATKGTEMWELEYDQMHESAIQLSKIEPTRVP